MSFRQSISGFLLLVAAALVGVALIVAPNWLISQYRTVRDLGGIWGTLYLIVVSAGVVLLLGSALWIVWKLWGRSIAKKMRRVRRSKNPSELSLDQMSAEFDENIEAVQRLKTASSATGADQEIDGLVRDLGAKRQRQSLEIVAFGTISSGKSSVLNALAGRDLFPTDIRGGTTTRRSEIPWDKLDRVVLVDTPGLGEVDGADHIAVSTQAAKDADLVLLVVDGPLRQSEYQLLERLGQMEKHIIVCLNKSDWYQVDDRQKLIGQIVRQTTAFVEDEDVVAIQANQARRRRRRVADDGSTHEELVDVPLDIEPLADRMSAVLRRDGKELLSANLLLQSRGLVEKARNRVQESIDRQAWATVDRYMWGAGGAAAVIPFPVVDLAAGVGISTKMILDLAEIYQQKVDLETARRWLGEMGKNLIGVLGANLAAPAIVSVVGSLIKTVPVAGTIAGGVLQGAVQALITKWIGSVFIEYFRNEMNVPEGGLAGLARRQWEQITTISELGKLIQAARKKLSRGESN